MSYLKFLKSKRPLVCAHRGAKAKFPENSLPSFQEAARLNVDILETDVHLTKDNELVIFHDESLDRTTDKKGLIRDYTLEELRQIDVGYNFLLDGQFPFRGKNLHILTLKNLFEAFPSFWINIDIKTNEFKAAEILVRLLREYNREKSVIIGSFHPPVLEYFRKMAPNVATAAHPGEVRRFIIHLRTHTLTLFKPRFAAFQVPIKHGETTIITRKFIQAAHKKGIVVMVWTINDEKTMNWLLDLEIDGIFTDDPQLMLHVLEKRQEI
ncbi:MAG: glycerophosphodiester phosphodiesterase [Candidatus Hermodarchaeota archaeon]